MTVGQRIRQRRQELNMSQGELAEKLGYKSKSSINKIELDIYNLKQSKIAELADALQTTPAYIMGWSDEDDLKDYRNKYGSGTTSYSQDIALLFNKYEEQSKQLDEIIKRQTELDKQTLDFIREFSKLDQDSKDNIMGIMKALSSKSQPKDEAPDTKEKNA